MERAFKIYVARKDPDGLSVMHPKHYMQRFQNCMQQIFETNNGTGTKISSRNTSVQNFAALAPIPEALAPKSAAFEAVMNPLLQHREQHQERRTPKKKAAKQQAREEAAAKDELEAVDLSHTVNTINLVDDSVDYSADDFAEYLDTTAAMNSSGATALEDDQRDEMQDSMDML